MPAFKVKYTAFVYKLTTFSNNLRRIGTFHAKIFGFINKKNGFGVILSVIKTVTTTHILFKKHTLKITTITSRA
jgi:hypothetical protein